MFSSSYSIMEYNHLEVEPGTLSSHTRRLSLAVTGGQEGSGPRIHHNADETLQNQDDCSRDYQSNIPLEEQNDSIGTSQLEKTQRNLLSPSLIPLQNTLWVQTQPINILPEITPFPQQIKTPIKNTCHSCRNIFLQSSNLTIPCSCNTIFCLDCLNQHQIAPSSMISSCPVCTKTCRCQPCINLYSRFRISCHKCGDCSLLRVPTLQKPTIVLSCSSKGCQYQYCLNCVREKEKGNPFRAHITNCQLSRWVCYHCQDVCDCNLCVFKKQQEGDFKEYQRRKEERLRGEKKPGGLGIEESQGNERLNAREKGSRERSRDHRSRNESRLDHNQSYNRRNSPKQNAKNSSNIETHPNTEIFSKQKKSFNHKGFSGFYQASKNRNVKLQSKGSGPSKRIKVQTSNQKQKVSNQPRRILNFESGSNYYIKSNASNRYGMEIQEESLPKDSVNAGQLFLGLRQSTYQGEF